MTKNAIIQKLTAAISQTKRSGGFYADGELNISDPGLNITGVGPVKLPMRPADVRALAAVTRQAPYGKGTRTLVDTTVRDTLEVAGEEVELSADFNQAIQTAVQRAADALGLPRDRVRPELYKLLIYQKGGFFLPHRDSEKRPGMVASMIVVLPSTFGGGGLFVRHENRSKFFDFRPSRNAGGARYVAFYADCEHEVRRVTSGVRVCLAYNLMMPPARASKAAKPRGGADPGLVQAVTQWMHERGNEPMVFALEHQYTQQGLKPELLKGADREVFGQLAAVSQQCECRLHLGQVSRHLSQFATDDNYGYTRRGYRSGPVDFDELEIGEVYEDEIRVDGWKDWRGKRVALGELACDSSMLVSTTPVEDWIPTQQDYEGYTGNAGNVLDRWYHKSAIVLWSEQHHFDVIARIDLRAAIEMLLEMRAKLIKTPEEKLEKACEDCQALAEAIIQRWPHRIYQYDDDQDADPAWLKDFASELPKFDDPDLVGKFLQMLAQRDWTLKLDKLVLASSERMGADAVAPLLLQFIRCEPEPNRYGRRPAEGLAPRDAAWLNTLCQDRLHGGLSRASLAELLAVALERWSRQAEAANHQRYERDRNLGAAWLLLCKAALTLADTDTSKRLFALAAKHSQAMDMRAFQVPAAVQLHSWASKRLEQVPRPLSDWIGTLRVRMKAATRVKPAPPETYSRPGDTGCSCRFCQQLQSFLTDPGKSTARIPAREEARSHLQDVIRRRQLDVEFRLDRSTRPFALSLKKTTATFSRELQQYEQDLKLLASLPGV